MERTLDFFNPCDDIRDRLIMIGIDPGVTTGLSVMVISDPAEGLEGIMAWGSDQLSYGGSGNISDLYTGEVNFPEQEISQKIGRAIKEWAKHNRVIVAIEDFIIRQKNSGRNFLSPVRITSGIMQEIFGSGLNISVTFQSPSDAKGTCKDERMDLWGFPIKTQKDRHSRDADRHLILCLRRMMANPAVQKDLLSVP